MWDLLLKQAFVVPNVYIYQASHIQPSHIVYNSLAKELWRLRVNFFALLVLLLASVGYVSPLASLHQFGMKIRLPFDVHALLISAEDVIHSQFPSLVPR